MGPEKALQGSWTPLSLARIVHEGAGRLLPSSSGAVSLFHALCTYQWCDTGTSLCRDAIIIHNVSWTFHSSALRRSVTRVPGKVGRAGFPVTLSVTI